MADIDGQLWISFVSILATFNITKAKDEGHRGQQRVFGYGRRGVGTISYLEISIVDPTFFSATRNLSDAQYSPGRELVGD